MAKPADAKEIVAILDDLKTNVYSEQDEQIQSTRDTRELKKNPSDLLPQKWVNVDVQDTTVAEEIIQAADTLNANPPKWHIERPQDAPDEQQQNATLREKFAAGLFDFCAKGEDGIDTRERLVDGCVGDGGAWSKFLFSKDLWEERYAVKRGETESAGDYVQRTDEAAKRAGPPFYFGYADPLNVYPTFSGRKLEEVFEVSERPLYTTLRKYRLTVSDDRIVPGDIGQPGPAGRHLPSNVTWIERWTDEQCTYVVDAPGIKEPYALEPFEHRYGRAPYFPAYGFMNGYWSNRKVGWGVAQSLRWLCDYMSYLECVHAQVAARDAMTPVLEYLEEDARPAGTGQHQAPRKIPIGEIIPVPYGRKYERFPITDTAPALREQIAMIGDKIEKMRLPRVASQIGAGGGLEGAGFATYLILQESKIYLYPYIKHIENCYEQMTYFMESLIRDVVRERVFVFVGADKNYLGEGPQDLERAVKYTVELDPQQPPAKLIESRYWAEQVQARFASQDMAVEAQGRNPDEVRMGLDAEEARNDPRVKQWRMDTIVQSMGYGHIMQIANQATRVVQTGQFPNGQPVVPPAMGDSMGAPDMGALSAAPNQTVPGNNGVANAPGNRTLGTSPGAVVGQQREATATEALAS